MIKSIFMLIVGFIAGMILGPQIDFAQPEDIDFRNFSLEDIPKLVKYQPEEDTPEKKVATKVINGDTFLIEGGTQVRLLAIDAAEEGQPCYKEAKDRLTSLISGKTVTLEKTARNKNDKGDLLRVAKINNLNVNKSLLKEGVAVARFFEGTKLNKTPYRQAESFAKENKIGCKWRNTETSTSTESGE